jgi:hypothetical protein
MGERPEYWFAAKRYGYGWGWPLTWQGWVTLLVYVAAVAGPPVALRTGTGEALSIGALLVGTPILIAICYRKGEPAKWRWGGGKD